MRRVIPIMALVILAACGQRGDADVRLTRGVVDAAPVAAEPPPTLPEVVEAPPAPPAPTAPAPAPAPVSGASYEPRTVTRCGPLDIANGPFYVAEATGASIPIFQSPGEGAPVKVLPSPNQYGVPQVFLVKGQQGDWYNVMLPIRPNGSSGWVRAADVDMHQHSYRIVVQLGAHMITVTKGSEVIIQAPVGLGRAGTATPCGEYYINELLKPANAGGPYGPYAFGISGFSDVLYNFAGGNGQIGIHGTNDPGGLGRSVSHGCIRVGNDNIARMAQELPLGTPVYITP